MNDHAIRKSDQLAFGTVLGILGSLVGLLTFFWVVTQRLDENSRAGDQAVENRILNRVQSIERNLYDCCGKRR